MDITLSFDIGYASIGWAVLSSSVDALHPEFLGTGVVTFPADDCLASKRRDLRRARRNIRSTRYRVERMKRWLVHQGVLSKGDIERPGHPAPFLLCAAALRGHRILDAYELWTVLRWYAHNRGYDGNSRWASNGSSEEDSEKEQMAIDLMMREPVTGSMAETVCKLLGLNPEDAVKKISSHLPYKTHNAAFPRRVVSHEVSKLLKIHQGKIRGLDDLTVKMILKTDPLVDEDRSVLKSANIDLPKRYCGGLLFGQLVPRFDNRIVSRCPITWVNVFDQALRDGKTEAEARTLAEKYAKVPAAKTTEFLEYRFARILANIRANGMPLDKRIRKSLWDLAKKQGRVTASDIRKTIVEYFGDVSTNLEAYFKIHPDSEKALVMDPVMDEVRKAGGSRAGVSGVWKLLSDSAKEKVIDRWKHNRHVSLSEMLGFVDDPVGKSRLSERIKADFDNYEPKKGKPAFSSIESYMDKNSFGPEFPSGRAPYARPVLRKVVEEVLEGWDPTRSSATDENAQGQKKDADGVLYCLQDPSSRVRQMQSERPLDELTNNHLVRQRLLILERLLDDLVDEFASDSNTVGRVVVEVARELGEFSGMTAKKISAELNSRLKDFKGAVDYLAKNAPDLPISGSIIRKARIAMDLDWRCPFTGERYDAYDLPLLEREHIIPYATRHTNALHALVLTWPEVNKMKGKRTAQQFINDSASLPSRQVSGKERLTIFTPKQYGDFVDKLDTRGHPDDQKRKRARKALLMTVDFEDKELGFTDAALTKTSHLNKLALRAVVKRFPKALCDPIPGQVTAEIRKAWDLTGTLALACPEVIDPSLGRARPKDEIRGLTHMHHALDAATLALASYYFPLQSKGLDQKGSIWEALLKRNRSETEKAFLFNLGIFDRFQRTRKNEAGKEYREWDVRLRDLPSEVKNRLSRSLAECRVVQHIPSDRSGAKLELTTWGVDSIEGDGDNARVKLRQRTCSVNEGLRVRSVKSAEERAGKLMGLNPKNGVGKLKSIKGVMVIGENYGMALDPQPEIIPFHNVPERLESLRRANGGKRVRVLRNGMLIEVRGWRGKEGLWRILSCKSTLTLDLVRPHGIKASWREVSVVSLLKKGVILLPQKYSGFSSLGPQECHTTSSA